MPAAVALDQLSSYVSFIAKQRTLGNMWPEYREGRKGTHLLHATSSFLPGHRNSGLRRHTTPVGIHAHPSLRILTRPRRWRNVPSLIDTGMHELGLIAHIRALRTAVVGRCSGFLTR